MGCISSTYSHKVPELPRKTGWFKISHQSVDQFHQLNKNDIIDHIHFSPGLIEHLGLHPQIHKCPRQTIRLINVSAFCHCDVFDFCHELYEKGLGFVIYHPTPSVPQNENEHKVLPPDRLDTATTTLHELLQCGTYATNAIDLVGTEYHWFVCVIDDVVAQRIEVLAQLSCKVIREIRSITTRTRFMEQTRWVTNGF